MQEKWSITDQPVGPAEATAIVEAIERRLARGDMTTWLSSSLGRQIAFVSNGPRAMVMLLRDDQGDPGEHAIDPSGEGSSHGFVLDNGQADEYADRDTVPTSDALRIVSHLLQEGVPPVDASWAIDR